MNETERFRAEVAARLKEARLNAGYKSAADAAAALGVVGPSYDHWESGEWMVPRARIVSICATFGVSVDWLLTGLPDSDGTGRATLLEGENPQVIQ